MKKYLCIFLVFFLLFGFSVPVFAETTPEIVPPVLEEPYDSYIITYVTTDMGANEYYYCWIYDSSVWDIYVKPDTDRVRGIFFGNDYPSRVRRFPVLISDYDPSSSNNGWGDGIITNPDTSGTSTDGTEYYLYLFSGSSVVSANVDIPYANVNLDTKTVNDTGEFFFTLTPLLAVEVEKALTLFQTQTSHNLMIIVLCGVGCLALLISLPLLKRVLLQFLNR